MEGTIADIQPDSLSEKLKKILEPTPGSLSLCPVRDILDRLSDKWSALSIFYLGEAGTLRFNELRKRIDGISQRMLTVTLRNLERDGLVNRRMYPEIPPRVEYELTELGHSFLRQLIELGEWAIQYSAPILKARERYDARGQESVPVEW